VTRQGLREKNDKVRIKKGKDVTVRSSGPTTINELAGDISSFIQAVCCLDRSNVVCVVGAAGDEVAALYPRRDSMGAACGESHVPWTADPADAAGKVKTGIAALMERSTGRTDPGDGTTAISSALSVALCLINRFMLARGGGTAAGAVSASEGGEKEEATILSMVDRASGPGGEPGRRSNRRGQGGIRPRILVVQCTQDRTGDYNAFMNCTFACMKAGICIDGLFLPDGQKKKARTSGGADPSSSGARRPDQSSVFLEQAADRTGGIYLAPTCAAQACGGLLTVLVTAFLSPEEVRAITNNPVQDKVDFRARCFTTGDSVDVAYVCNVCLSIFKDVPRDEDGEEGECPTCGAVMERVKRLKKAKANGIKGEVEESLV